MSCDVTVSTDFTIAYPIECIVKSPRDVTGVPVHVITAQARSTAIGGGPAGGASGVSPGNFLKLGCKILHSGHFWPWSGEKVVRPKPDRPDRLLRPCSPLGTVT